MPKEKIRLRNVQLSLHPLAKRTTTSEHCDANMVHDCNDGNRNMGSSDDTTGRSTDNTHINIPLSSITSLEKETTPERNAHLDVVKYYYQTILKYPYVYSGLQFGCHYVLYQDHPQRVHSTYAIYVIYPTVDDATVTTGTNPIGTEQTHTNIPWYTIQTLVRMMADLHKTLILVHVEEVPTLEKEHDTAQTLRSDDCCNMRTDSAAIDTTADEKQPSKTSSKIVYYPCNKKNYSISELTITTEHAPFRQQQQNNNLSKVT